MKTMPRLLPAIPLLLLPALAHAHPGHGAGDSFLTGAVHPLAGFDHLLALIATGLLAWRLSGHARAVITFAFPALLAAGAALGLAGIELAGTESMILLSIAVLAALAVHPPRRLPVTTVALAAMFAVFHGHAHGLEAATGVAGPAFVAGMTLASALVVLATMAGAQAATRRFAR
jgi:urease accessory protein